MVANDKALAHMHTLKSCYHGNARAHAFCLFHAIDPRNNCLWLDLLTQIWLFSSLNYQDILTVSDRDCTYTVSSRRNPSVTVSHSVYIKKYNYLACSMNESKPKSNSCHYLDSATYNQYFIPDIIMVYTCTFCDSCCCIFFLYIY